MLHETAAPMCPAAGHDREDVRHEAIVRMLADVASEENMHEAMIDAFHWSQELDKLFSVKTQKAALEAGAAFVNELRIAAIRERSTFFRDELNYRDSHTAPRFPLNVTGADIYEAAPDAVYFMQEGRMP